MTSMLPHIAVDDRPNRPGRPRHVVSGMTRQYLSPQQVQALDEWLAVNGSPGLVLTAAMVNQAIDAWNAKNGGTTGA